MESSQATINAFEKLVGEPLTNEEVSEMISNLTMFIEMLAEIDLQQKEQLKA